MKTISKFKIIIFSIIIYAPLRAADFTVTTLADSGPGSLRQAILRANASAEADNITFEGLFSDTIPDSINLTSQLPAFIGPTSIHGTGADMLTVQRPASATTDFRIMEILGSGDVTLSDMTIRGGKLGADMNGGGISNLQGRLTLNRVVITENSVGQSGGGIYNFFGNLILNQCVLSNNNADAGGGLLNQLDNNNTNTFFIMTESILQGNRARLGGGLFQSTGKAILNRCTIIGNSSTAFGGGIASIDVMTINQSTISGNTSSSAGGGVFNSTNRFTLNQSTITGNVSTLGSGVRINAGMFDLNNSIVAGNTLTGSGAMHPDISINTTASSIGQLISNGFNFVGDATGATGLTSTDKTFATTSTTLSQLLNSNLSNNGGFTRTHALVAGSLAIDAGNTSFVTAQGFSTDQRGAGFSRVFESSVDIGAVEFIPATPLRTWRAVHKLATDGSQDLANPSGDGVPNILKYAFNLAPNEGDLMLSRVATLPLNGNAGLPNISRNTNGQLVIVYLRRKASSNPSTTYTPETGSTLSDFFTFTSTPAEATTPIDNTWERVTVTDPTISPKRFGRVRVSTNN